jgi:squalene-associated FAD-dependent desaturase
LNATAQRIAIVGGGWAGMSAAVAGVLAGHQVTVFEAAQTLGGRARALPCRMPDGTTATLDNGQHILIGAYSETLRVLQLVGIAPARAFLRLPLRMVFPDGGGLRLPRWPPPLDALAGIGLARGWSLADKAALLRVALRWRVGGFACDGATSVAELCKGLTPRPMAELIEPLCVSALNIAPAEASGQVFLRVLHDSLFGGRGASNLLLPRMDLSALFPQAAARWITERGAQVHRGARVQPRWAADTGWQVGDARFDQVLLATAAPDAARLVEGAAVGLAGAALEGARAWCARAQDLQHTAIATVYAWGRGVGLAQPMIALRGQASGSPGALAQFVFDRGQLGGPPGLLAFVVSASSAERNVIEQQVLEQARTELGLVLTPVQTVVEKRATFACVPGLQRPPMRIAPGLRASGDYVQGPYPATLEAAVRAGVAAMQS